MTVYGGRRSSSSSRESGVNYMVREGGNHRHSGRGYEIISSSTFFFFFFLNCSCQAKPSQNKYKYQKYVSNVVVSTVETTGEKGREMILACRPPPFTLHKQSDTTDRQCTGVQQAGRQAAAVVLVRQLCVSSSHVVAGIDVVIITISFYSSSSSSSTSCVSPLRSTAKWNNSKSIITRLLRRRRVGSHRLSSLFSQVVLWRQNEKTIFKLLPAAAARHGCVEPRIVAATIQWWVGGWRWAPKSDFPSLRVSHLVGHTSLIARHTHAHVGILYDFFFFSFFFSQAHHRHLSGVKGGGNVSLFAFSPPHLY